MLSAKSHYPVVENDETSSFYSVKVDLHGRIMRENNSEQKCYINQMSPAIASFIAPYPVEKGERIVAYIDQIGRLEGNVHKIFNGGFDVMINATVRKQNKLAAQLTWIANKHELGTIEDRKYERISPSKTESRMRLEDGQVYPCRIIDVSVSGAAFETNIKPPEGSTIWLGSIEGRVIRHFDTGISMEFLNIQTIEDIQRSL